MSELFANALIVEDEPHLATALSASLKRLKITVHHSPTLQEAHAHIQAAKKPEELILLDRRLPDGDGLDFCKRLRAQGYGGVILILTASGHVRDRVEGLDAGADDYLPKPFSWDELVARIRALARRPSSRSSAALWEVDEGQLRVKGPKGWISLTPLEFKLLARLMKNPSTIVQRAELLKDVWGFKWLPNTRTVDHFMGRLRKHFELDPENPRHFITVRGAGYRFEA